jgi:hypothetical protein
LLAHSFYKAYAFLSTGGLVEDARHSPSSYHVLPRKWTALIIASTFAMTMIALSWQYGAHLVKVTYIAVLLLGLGESITAFGSVHDFKASKATGVLLSLAAATLCYVAAESSMTHILTAQPLSQPLTQALSAAGESSSMSLATVLTCLFGLIVFATGFWLAQELRRTGSRFQARLYVALWNGHYFAQYSTRVLARIWPAQQKSNVTAINRATAERTPAL